MVPDPPTAVGLISNGQLNESWICMCGESVSARKSCGLRPQRQSASVVSWKHAGALMDRDRHLQLKMPPHCSFTLPTSSALNEPHQSPPAKSREKHFLVCQNTQFWHWGRNSSAWGGSANVSCHHTPTGGNCFDIRERKAEATFVPRWKRKQAAHFAFILLIPEATLEISCCFPASKGKSTRTQRRWFPENNFIGDGHQENIISRGTEQRFGEIILNK